MHSVQELKILFGNYSQEIKPNYFQDQSFTATMNHLHYSIDFVFLIFLHNLLFSPFKSSEMDVSNSAKIWIL